MRDGTATDQAVDFDAIVFYLMSGMTDQELALFWDADLAQGGKLVREDQFWKS